VTTSADELRAAAARLRELATAVPAPPWSPGGIGDYGWTIHCGDLAIDRNSISLDTRMDNDEGEALAQYIAAMHPDVGTALADLLDTAATDTDITGPDPQALTIARLINQEQQ
jgi:hypothetical protein